MNDIDKCNAAMDRMQRNQPQQPQPVEQCANRSSTGYEDTNSIYSNICKIDKRTDAATLIVFDSLKHVTKEGNVEAGAILIEILEKEYWIPKKLCSNLDTEAGTVYVWTLFLEDSKPELLDMIAGEE